MSSAHPSTFFLPTIPPPDRGDKKPERKGENKNSSYNHCFSTIEDPETYYTTEQASSKNKISPTSTGQTKESPHPRGRAGSYRRHLRHSQQGANSYHLLWCVAPFTLPSENGRLPSPYVNRRRRMASVFFHLPGQSVDLDPLIQRSQVLTWCGG